MDYRRLRVFRFLVVLGACTLAACAAKRQPLEDYVAQQEKKVQEKSAYIQADFDFWAAIYEPTADDLEDLRRSWISHGQAFPESKTMTEIEREVQKSSQRTVLVSLFMTAYENADLKDKSLGWSVHPIPKNIKELSETDVVLRSLMPVRNRWARYFILAYPPEIWSSTSSFVVSNRTSRIEFSKKN